MNAQRYPGIHMVPLKENNFSMESTHQIIQNLMNSEPYGEDGMETNPCSYGKDWSSGLDFLLL